MENKKKTKLLFVMYDRPNYPGGPIINYTRILPILVKQGYDVHALVLYWDDYPNARQISEQQVHIIPKKFSIYTKEDVHWMLQKAAIIQPDIFIPDVSTPGCFAAYWLQKSGIPCINSHRSDDELNWGKALYFSDAANKFNVNAIFCVSDYLRKELWAKIDKPNIHSKVIPSGVNISEHYSKQLSETLKIVYAGRLVQKQKRIVETIQVLVKIVDKFPNISVTFIGDGPDRDKCQEIVAASNNQKRFIFTGKLEGETYKNELAKNDVIFLLSDYEGVPGSIMDGMSCGLIPVCYNYSGVDELVDDKVNGFIVNDREQSIFEVVQFLILKPEERIKLSNAARQKIINGFSVEYTISQWKVFFDELIAFNGKSKKFKAPNRIKLPKKNNLLLEYLEEPKKVPLANIRYKLKIRTRIKSIFKRDK